MSESWPWDSGDISESARRNALMHAPWSVRKVHEMDPRPPAMVWAEMEKLDFWNDIGAVSNALELIDEITDSLAGFRRALAGANIQPTTDGSEA